MRVSFEPEARSEFLRAITWYVDEAGAAAAEAFLREVRQALRLLRERPRIGAPAAHGLRRIHLRRYPYTLYYRIDPDVLRILALAHQSRRPEYWSDRT